MISFLMDEDFIYGFILYDVFYFRTEDDFYGKFEKTELKILC